MSDLHSVALAQFTASEREKRITMNQAHRTRAGEVLGHGLRTIHHHLKNLGVSPKEIRVLSTGAGQRGRLLDIHVLVDGVHFSLLEPAGGMEGRRSSGEVRIHWVCCKCGADDNDILFEASAICHVVAGRLCKECSNKPDDGIDYQALLVTITADDLSRGIAEIPEGNVFDLLDESNNNIALPGERIASPSAVAI